MDAVVLSGSASLALAQNVAAELRTRLASCNVRRFPDGEFNISVSPGLSGRDVYLIQSTGHDIHSNFIEIMMLADACHRVGSSRVTAVIPYLGYARQDRRSNSGSPVGLRVIADMVSCSHVDRLLVVDPHIAGLEAVFTIPLERTTAVPTLASRIAEDVAEDTVIVAPDLGAVKLAERYASRLQKPIAVIRKFRSSAKSVEALGVVGDIQGHSSLVVDDMITTGATIEAAVHLLLEAGSRADLMVAATHGVMTAGAAERMRALPLRRVFLTDSLMAPQGLPSITICSIAPLLAEAILRLNLDRSLEDLELFA